MTRTICVDVKFTIEDPIQVAKFIQNQSFIHRYDAALTAGLMFVAFAVLIILIAGDVNGIYWFGTLAFSAVMAALAGGLVFLYRKILLPRWTKWRVKRFFQSSPISNQELRIEFSNEGIRSTGELSSSFVKWEAITRAAESDTHLMLHTNNEKFGWFVPKNAFASHHDLDIVKVLIRAVLSDRAKLA
jgi:hypothetical protein